MRLAGPIDDYAAPVKQFARNLGVAFQILNDLNDWRVDQHNKLSQGGDILGGRPTVLWALALEGLGAEQQQLLHALIEDSSQPAAVSYQPRPTALPRSRGLRQSLPAGRQARATCRRGGGASCNPPELQRLFRYLIEAVLERPDDFEFGIESPEKCRRLQ